VLTTLSSHPSRCFPQPYLPPSLPSSPPPHHLLSHLIFEPFFSSYHIHFLFCHDDTRPSDVQLITWRPPNHKVRSHVMGTAKCPCLAFRFRGRCSPPKPICGSTTTWPGHGNQNCIRGKCPEVGEGKIGLLELGLCGSCDWDMMWEGRGVKDQLESTWE
jgi:hypothetical protein